MQRVALQVTVSSAGQLQAEIDGFVMATELLPTTIKKIPTNTDYRQTLAEHFKGKSETIEQPYWLFCVFFSSAAHPARPNPVAKIIHCQQGW